ncbi:hypothetical protein ACFLTE_12600, partial [Bacteroidota bacterium]
LILIIFVNRHKIRYNNNLYLALIIIIISLIVNSFICGTFSIPVGRYQGRIIWLLPFMLIVFIFEQIDFKNIVLYIKTIFT